MLLCPRKVCTRMRGIEASLAGLQSFGSEGTVCGKMPHYPLVRRPSNRFRTPYCYKPAESLVMIRKDNSSSQVLKLIKSRINTRLFRTITILFLSSQSLRHSNQIKYVRNTHLGYPYSCPWESWPCIYVDILWSSFADFTIAEGGPC